MGTSYDESLSRLWLKTIANSIREELLQKFGREASYTPEQILEACEARNCPENEKEIALSMFSEPGKLREMFPEEYFYDPAEDLRKVRSRKITYSEEWGNDAASGGF